MVEFSLFFLAFFFLVVGLIEGSMMMWTYSNVTFAARHGARAAMVMGENYKTANSVTDNDVKVKIANAVKSRIVGLNKTNVSVNTSWTGDNEPGGLVAVQVSYPWKSVTTLLMGGSTMTMKSTSQATVAN